MSVLLLSWCFAVGGCGGATSPDGARLQATPSSPLDLPAAVPLKATRRADPAAASVVRAWSSALRHGDVVAATALWAVPSKVQNGTPVLRLASRTEVLAFNATLPCGSVVTSTGGAQGFTIATFRLTERKGGDCTGSAGAIARTAIRVRDGKIVEWYRLPDDPDSPGLRTDDVESTAI